MLLFKDGLSPTSYRDARDRVHRARHCLDDVLGTTVDVAGTTMPLEVLLQRLAGKGPDILTTATLLRGALDVLNAFIGTKGAIVPMIEDVRGNFETLQGQLHEFADSRLVHLGRQPVRVGLKGIRKKTKRLCKAVERLDGLEPPFCRHLRQLVDKSGFTKYELARRASIDPTYPGRMLNGERRPSKRVTFDLVCALLSSGNRVSRHDALRLFDIHGHPRPTADQLGRKVASIREASDPYVVE